MTDLEILEYRVGNQTLKELSTLTFYQWIAKKIDGIESTSAASTELRLAISTVMFPGKLADEEKVRLFRKLETLGVEL